MYPKHVTVFGGSQPKPGEPAYDEALRLGHLLGAAGCTVLTGGYMGTMEAVSRGAVEAGGHVIGVTCAAIERWRDVGPNPWVQEEWRCQDLPERVKRLIDGCDAALALPGGPGTLAEVALTWNLLLTDGIPPKPLILIGPGWRTIFETFVQTFDAYIPASQRRWLGFADDVETAVKRIENKKK